MLKYKYEDKLYLTVNDNEMRTSYIKGKRIIELENKIQHFAVYK